MVSPEAFAPPTIGQWGRYGPSCKTGCKIFNRYKEIGLEGLQNQSRRPYRNASKIPFQVELTILRIKKERPH